ncbi:hypothetical protein LVJ82_04590 [Vitreoscilla massiliensis]|uniref:Uncharacterized protein n=1 Tax=Vitreoscilla massiliensis TaxID=1689272 RepID=A0ABY4E440_9NEIS|nr:hypothetical protein [Vitreoscilla massiliensis]UOO90269.1 hypothetical protein LVJ82_04590 [Vitreoscilla massiliensis]
MANLIESPVWEPGVRQIETSDPVMGGANGVTNTTPRQLANRTVYLKVQTDSLSADKANKTTKVTAGTGLTGGGTLASDRTFYVDFASADEAKTGNMSNKAIHPTALALSAYFLANTRYDGSPTEGDANDFEIGTRYACSAAILNTPIANVWWEGSYAFIETRYIHTGGQKIQIAWGYDRVNLAMRTYIANTWSSWRTMMGADWAATGNNGIRNKPTTAAGYGLTDVFTKSEINDALALKASKGTTLASYGIKDWVLTSTSSGSGTAIATASGQGIHSFGVDSPDAPTWSNGENVGASKVFQVGPANWDSQFFFMAYGDPVFIRSRLVLSGAYQSWKRVDGADWNATERMAGYIYNKPTTLAGYGITDAALNTNSIIAGTGMTGGGTYGASRTLNIDKATAANITAGTANKVVCADILKPLLDAATKVRLGAETSVNTDADGSYKAASGNVLTGYDLATTSGSRNVTKYHTRPMQAQINGVWVTVAAL